MEPSYFLEEFYKGIPEDDIDRRYIHIKAFMSILIFLMMKEILLLLN
jgi:hypothetical protein